MNVTATVKTLVGIPADKRNHRNSLLPPSLFCVGEGGRARRRARFLSPHSTFSRDQGTWVPPTVWILFLIQRDLKVQEGSPSAGIL